MVLADASAPLGPLQVNATLIAELIAFLIMLGILARWVYPPVIRAAEARQKQVADQLAAAEKARQDSEEYLQQAQASIQQAQVSGQQIIDRANRSAEQVRRQIEEKAHEEGLRIVEQAKKDIDSERQRAIQAIRQEMGDLVVSATQKILGESMDGKRHRKLIEQAIQQVGSDPGAS